MLLCCGLKLFIRNVLFLICISCVWVFVFSVLIVLVVFVVVGVGGVVVVLLLLVWYVVVFRMSVIGSIVVIRVWLENMLGFFDSDVLNSNK